MADFVTSNPGQVNGAGSAVALYMKLYSGEVLTAFKPECIALQLTKVRTLTKGKSFQFPMIGRSPQGKYVKPGVEVVPEDVKHGEITITADELVTTQVFVGDLDESLQHYETRAEYSADCARQLAETIDRNIFRMLGKAALATSLTALVGSKVTAEEVATFAKRGKIELKATNANGEALTPAQSFVDALYRAKTKFRLLNIPTSGLKCVTDPEHFELLVNASGNIGSMAWMNRDVGGEASMNAETLVIAGIPVIMTNHMPSKTVGADDATKKPEGWSNYFEGGVDAIDDTDFSSLKAIVFTVDAVATVKVKDISTQVIPVPLRNGHVLMSKMAIGHGFIRPVCALGIVAPAGAQAAAVRKAK